MMKLLESERLSLRALTHGELYHINNEKLDKLEIAIEKEAIMDNVKIAIAKKIEKMKKAENELYQWYTYWIIINKESDKGIGFIGFKGVPNEEGYTEVGYSISPNYRKMGLMTEALSLMINWAFSYDNCNGITARRVLKSNVGSNNVLRNCNFKMDSSSEEQNNYILKRGGIHEKYDNKTI